MLLTILLYEPAGPFSLILLVFEKKKQQDKVNRKELKRKGKHIPCSLVLTQNENTADQS